jgi:hypothetical protein
MFKVNEDNRQLSVIAVTQRIIKNKTLELFAQAQQWQSNSLVCRALCSLFSHLALE